MTIFYLILLGGLGFFLWKKYFSTLDSQAFKYFAGKQSNGWPNWQNVLFRYAAIPKKNESNSLMHKNKRLGFWLEKLKIRFDKRVSVVRYLTKKNFSFGFRVSTTNNWKLRLKAFFINSVGQRPAAKWTCNTIKPRRGVIIIFLNDYAPTGLGICYPCVDGRCPSLK